MTAELDNVVRAGAVTAAAIATRSVHCDFRSAVSAHGHKHPVAVLIRRDGVTLAFDIDGSPIAREVLERRFPGRCAEFERVATAPSTV